MVHLEKSRSRADCEFPKCRGGKVRDAGAKAAEAAADHQDLFDQGSLVGERGREEWPAGVLIDGERNDPTRAERTKEAIDRGATVVFEGCFEADGCLCNVDVLERSGDGWTLIEVKSSSEV